MKQHRHDVALNAERTGIAEGHDHKVDRYYEDDKNGRHLVGVHAAALEEQYWATRGVDWHYHEIQTVDYQASSVSGEKPELYWDPLVLKGNPRETGPAMILVMG